MKRVQLFICIYQFIIVRIFTKCPYCNFKGVENSFPRMFLAISHHTILSFTLLIILLIVLFSIRE